MVPSLNATKTCESVAVRSSTGERCARPGPYTGATEKPLPCAPRRIHALLSSGVKNQERPCGGCAGSNHGRCHRHPSADASPSAAASPNSAVRIDRARRWALADSEPCTGPHQTTERAHSLLRGPGPPEHTPAPDGRNSMIIWGSRGRTSVVQEGQFFCPRCRSNQPYKLKRVQRWFTLYFIPIIPMGVLGEYAECGQCLTTWKTEVLTAAPPADREQTVQDELRRAMRRSMAMVLLASGREDPAAIDAGSRIFRKQIGMSMPDAELSRELKDVKEQGIDVKRYLANFGAHLSAQQKEALVTAAC